MPLQLFRRSLSIFLVAVAILMPSDLLASGVEKRVVFPKGKTTVSYRGKLPRKYADYDAYVLKARKGQTLGIKFTTEESKASFAIYELNELGPEEDTIAAQDQTLRSHSVKLPITSKYAVQIYGVTSIDDGNSSQSPYTIEISLR